MAIIGNTYYNLSADSFVCWGAHTTGSDYEIYDNPEMDLAFPFSYNQSVNNTYSKTNYTAVGGISSYQTGNVTLTYDGYGNLMLPGGTYPNVVRVKKVRTNDLGPTLTSYTWYNSANGERLLFYEEKEGGTPNAVYNASIVSSVANLQHSRGISISTDMGQNNVAISATKNIDEINVYSIEGQMVNVLKNVNASHVKFSIGAARGIYIVNVKSGGEIVNRKVLF